MACVTLLLKILGVNVIPNVIISSLVYLIVLRITREPLLIEVKRVVLGGIAGEKTT